MNESKNISKKLFVQSDQIHTMIKEIFTNLSVDKKIAELCTDGLLHTSLRGVDTHGIRLAPHYADAIKSGRINPKSRKEIL